MEKNKEQQKEVKDFFNLISKNYDKKYEKNSIFLHYFFGERLIEATKGYSFENKPVLDIGAGNGALYEYLTANHKNLDYFAMDIAAKMLENGVIPTSKYFVGDISSFPKDKKDFEFIFLLGVTTYFDQNKLTDHFNFIQDHLSKDGQAIISFTNKYSIDFQIRRVVRLLTSKLKMKNRVMGQKFKVFAYSENEVSSLTNGHLTIEGKSYLNQTLPLFNNLFPKTSIKIGEFIKGNLKKGKLLSWLSSDFIVTLRPKK